MKKKTIKIPIYTGTLTIFLVDDLSYIQERYKTVSLSQYGAVTFKNESKYRDYIVAFESKDRSLIAHEIVHIINFIFLDCGVQLDRLNDETQAYLTGWLFDEIESFIYK